jgi:hypothetical protein
VPARWRWQLIAGALVLMAPLVALVALMVPDRW